MIDKIVQQLDSSDVNQRKKAIKALAQTKNPEALKYLAAVIRTDDNPEVVELARKAGVYIKKNAATNHYDEPLSYAADDRIGGYDDDDYYADDDEEDEPEPEPGVHVSVADEDRANGMVQQALDWHMRDDNDKAAQYLVRAFKTNPNLRRDAYTSGLAATVTGLGADEAVRLLMEEAQTVDKKKKEKRQNNKSRGDGEITWGDALIDLAIYFSADVGTTAISTLLLRQFAGSLVEQLAAYTTIDESITMAMNQMMELESIGIIFNAVSSGVMNIVGLLIFYGLVHIVATTILGGDGTFLHLIRKLTLFLTAASIALIVLVVIGLFMTLNNPDMLSTLFVIVGLFILIVLVFMGIRIGQNYEFGVGRGCATLIVLSVGACACSVAIPLMFGGGMG